MKVEDFQILAGLFKISTNHIVLAQELISITIRVRLAGVQILQETFQIQILHRNVSLLKQRESVKLFGYRSRFSLKWTRITEKHLLFGWLSFLVQKQEMFLCWITSPDTCLAQILVILTRNGTDSHSQTHPNSQQHLLTRFTLQKLLAPDKATLPQGSTNL